MHNNNTDNDYSFEFGENVNEPTNETSKPLQMDAGEAFHEVIIMFDGVVKATPKINNGSVLLIIKHNLRHSNPKSIQFFVTIPSKNVELYEKASRLNIGDAVQITGVPIFTGVSKEKIDNTLSYSYKNEPIPHKALALLPVNVAHVCELKKIKINYTREIDDSD
jgi:hypothetical protein